MSAAAALLKWYREHRRELPWRGVRDPWAILVSEFMLQQTRVEHVILYYARFLARFPTPSALAASPVEEALALWSGLGYYRRARLLHRAATQIAAAGGSLPADPAGLRALAGVGDYTAAAVASIAFGAVEPVLDGNVERVLCRWLGIAEDPRRAAVRRRLREAAAGLLDPAAPGDGNQALMELGATVCTPRAPRCASCPLAGGCVARAHGLVEALPLRPPRRPARARRLVAVRVERAGRTLLFRRAAGERVLPGTWELPWVERAGAGGEPSDGAGGGVGGAVEDGDARRTRVGSREDGREPGDQVLAAAFAARYGLTLALGEALGRVRHAITHRRLDVEVRRAWLVAAGAGLGGGGDAASGDAAEVAELGGARAAAAWLAPGEIAGRPMSSLVRKALALPATPAAAGASPPAPAATRPRRRRRHPRG